MLRIDMALQDGGAHVAFACGVLDRLLEADGIESAALSGTSARALNGAAYRSGVTARPAPGAAKGLSDWDRPDLPK